MSSTTQIASGVESSGKYLTFVLAGESYGISILGVREIIAVQPITPLPRMPAAVNGVINLRGKIIPVIDLRTSLSLHAAEFDRSTCIIVLDVDLAAGATQIGCIVDAVREVSNIANDELQPPPTVGGAVDADYFMALARPAEDDCVVTLLDIPHVLAELFGDSLFDMGEAGSSEASL